MFMSIPSDANLAVWGHRFNPYTAHHILLIVDRYFTLSLDRCRREPRDAIDVDQAHPIPLAKLVVSKR
ncbi:protein of unknown function [Hyphomicrobium sp. MC1]|nr:protein of unknown function [Hyphomicrobium sp. MC1]